MKIMKGYFALFSFLFSLIAYSNPQGLEDVNIIVKVNSVKELQKATGYPVAFENPQVAKPFKELGKNDELLLKGSIRYTPSSNKEGQTQLNPTFYIKEVHPVSLARLGQSKDNFQEQKITFKSEGYQGGKPIETNSEVAGTLILTASVLMLKEHSQVSGRNYHLKDNLNTNLIFTAGALATGLFIWEQLHKKKSKR